ncbi:MAG: AsmA family protein [Proteobacteria bacterium]|nr:AsmA family protein [Pseudomonadota bacterium]
MMKRLVATLFVLGLLILAAVLIVPSFIDWNQHKDQVLERLSRYFQHKIDIGGNISLQILPQPEVMLESVTVANAAGAKSSQLMTLKQLGVRVKFSPLLEGRIEVESLDLVGPVLNLEILPNSKPNWLDVLKEKSVDALGGAAMAVQLNQVRVVDGALNYFNPATGSKHKIDNLNLSIVADTLLGPYNATGSMEYRGLPVNVDIGTEKYTGTSPMQAHVSFMPVSGLPQVKFSGVVDVQSNMDVQGELLIDKGDLDSLFDSDFLKGINFLSAPTDLRAVLELKDGKASFSDIRAKFGQKGELLGKMSMQFTSDGKRYVRLEAEGNNLVVTDKPANVYLAVPDGFSGSLHAKGKNITWGGYKLGAAEVTTEFDAQEWRIKSAHVELPGGAQLKLAGVVLPSSDSGTYNIQLTTDDMSKMTGALLPAESSIFKSLSDTSIIKKMTLSSGLTVSPARISLFNMDALMEDKMKLSGVINIDRMLQKPNFVAKLNFSDWDISTIPPEVFDRFMQGVLKADADVELTSANFTRNGLKIPSMSLGGKMSEAGIDLTYAIKMAQAGDALASLPPPLLSWSNVDMRGEVKGNSQNYALVASGTVGSSETALNGTNVAGTYQLSVHMKDKNSEDGLALLGLPMGRLAGDRGALELAGDLKGTKDNYRIDPLQIKIDAVNISGALEKKDNKFTADLAIPKMDLDRWLTGAWNVRQDITLKLHGTDLVWQGLHISSPLLTAEVGAASIRVPDLTGIAWGGGLRADLALMHHEQGSWSSGFKGNVKQLDLNNLVVRLGLDGFTAGVGDIDFNLTSPDNTATAAEGGFAVKASNLSLDRFNFDKLGDAIDKTNIVSPTLQQIVDNSLRQNGSTTFKDVQGRFKVDKGKIDIDSLKLSHTSGQVDVSGAANIKASSYNVSGALLLSWPEGLGAIKVHRASGAADYTVDITPIEKFITKNTPVPVVMQPDVPPVPVAAEALPPVQNNPPVQNDNSGTGDIKNVLKRLDEEAPSLPPSVPSPPRSMVKPKADTDRELQNMLMQEMMQQEGSGIGTPKGN